MPLRSLVTTNLREFYAHKHGSKKVYISSIALDDHYRVRNRSRTGNSVIWRHTAAESSCLSAAYRSGRRLEVGRRNNSKYRQFQKSGGAPPKRKCLVPTSFPRLALCHSSLFVTPVSSPPQSKERCWDVSGSRRTGQSLALLREAPFHSSPMALCMHDREI